MQQPQCSPKNKSTLIRTIIRLPTIHSQQPKTDNNDELSELMHFNAQNDKDEQESETSLQQPPAEDFADAHQFEDLELGYDEKNANDADDDFLDEQHELEQELKLASLEDSSYSINEEAEPQADDVQQDEPETQPELEEPKLYQLRHHLALTSTQPKSLLKMSLLHLSHLQILITMNQRSQN